MIEKLRSKTRVLLELQTGILFVGVLVLSVMSITLYFNMNSTLIIDSSVLLGWSLGVLIALCMAWHMWYNLDKALELCEDDAVKKVRNNYLLRYTVVVLAVIMMTNIANPLATFFGILSLKVAAYLQPFTHRFYNKIFNEKDPIPQPMEDDEVVENEQ